MVGITGTNGKTTTAYVLDSALRALAHVVGLIGTVETRIGEVRFPSARTTPEAPDVHALVACMREANVDTCVMEVSSHALTLNRVDGLLFDVAIFTNLSQDHLDLHKTMGEYFAAKASLFTPQRCRRAIICVDDEWGRRLAAQASVPVVTVGSRAETSPDYLVVGDPHDDGAFDLITPDGKPCPARSTRSTLPSPMWPCASWGSTPRPRGRPSSPTRTFRVGWSGSVPSRMPLSTSPTPPTRSPPR